MEWALTSSNVVQNFIFAFFGYISRLVASYNREHMDKVFERVVNVVEYSKF